ncbi:MAG: glycyl-radical enzyme activating protein [Anaerolineae bacterium]
MVQGLITNVQRFSIHDGPGIRTTVFFKGCPLRCFWCHNPETWVFAPEVQLYPARCLGCGACVERCSHGAQLLVEGERRYLREQCVACGACVDTCYAEALVLCGRWWTPEALLAEVLKDRAFYEQSGGGVTLSGGEPLLQQEFVRAFLPLCKGAGLHTAIETSACAPWRELEALLPWLDLAMVDLKHMDAEAHRRATGASNRRILANLRRLAAAGLPLIVRTPVVPGVNDTVEAIAGIARFVAELPSLLYYELMPFHRLAEAKFRSLDLENRAEGLQPPAREQMEALVEVARGAGAREVRCG